MRSKEDRDAMITALANENAGVFERLAEEDRKAAEPGPWWERNGKDFDEPELSRQDAIAAKAKLEFYALAFLRAWQSGPTSDWTKEAAKDLANELK